MLKYAKQSQFKRNQNLISITSFFCKCIRYHLFQKDKKYVSKARNSFCVGGSLSLE